MPWTVIYDRLGNNPAYFKDGRVATREEFEAAFPPKELGAPFVAAPSCWPMTSAASGVDPSQVADATERNRAAGCSVTYTEDGKAVIPDRAERKKLNKLDGTFDRQGGYGD